MWNRTSRIGVALLLTAVIAAGCEDGANNGGRTPGPRLETLTIPAGTLVVAALDTRLSSDTNHTGDPFVATTTQPIVIDGKTVAPAGTAIHGTVRDIQASGRVKGRARMTLVYEEIVDAAGNAHLFSARPLTLQAASDAHGDIEKVAAGGVLGAVIGGIAAGGKGAAIGAGAGAGAGTVIVLATKGDDVELDPGQKLSIHVTAATSMPVLARR